jgi:hypothetical protein
VQDLEENGDALIKVSLEGLTKTKKNLSQDSLHPDQERWESSVSIATGNGLDGQGSIPGTGKIFPFSTVSRLVLGSTHPAIGWVPRAISLEVKWLGCEADHSLPSSAEVKNDGAILSLPHMSLWHTA